MKKNVVKINENTIRKIVAEALKFQRVTDPKNPKGNVGPKDENLNFFVTIGEGPNRSIVGDKGFKTREAAERKADALRRQGKNNVRIISKKSTNENTVKLSENTLRQIVAESVKKILSETWARPSEDTLMKVKELYDYLYNVQEESDATSALYKMIADWLNKQYQGEMNSAIGG